MLKNTIKWQPFLQQEKINYDDIDNIDALCFDLENARNKNLNLLNFDSIKNIYKDIIKHHTLISW